MAAGLYSGGAINPMVRLSGTRNTGAGRRFFQESGLRGIPRKLSPPLDIEQVGDLRIEPGQNVATVKQRIRAEFARVSSGEVDGH